MWSKEMQGRGIVFVISAPSGAGKTTLIREILKRISGLSYSISYTTRPPRPGEVNGRDYHFVTEEEFLRMMREGKFVEWARVHGFLYGTPKENLYPKPGTDVLLDIDPQGAKQVKEIRPDAVLIFIVPPSIDELERRLRERKEDSEEEIRKRLSNARKELDQVGLYDYIVVNDELDKALQYLSSIILAERCRTRRVLKEGLGWRV